MRDHERVHRELEDWKRRIERDELLAQSEDYNERGAALATLNAYLNPRYHNDLEDHLRIEHRLRHGDPWAYTHELEELHSGLHSQRSAGTGKETEGGEPLDNPDRLG